MCMKYMIKRFNKIHPIILAVISTSIWDYNTVLFLLLVYQFLNVLQCKFIALAL